MSQRWLLEVLTWRGRGNRIEWGLLALPSLIGATAAAIAIGRGDGGRGAVVFVALSYVALGATTRRCRDVGLGVRTAVIVVGIWLAWLTPLMFPRRYAAFPKFIAFADLVVILLIAMSGTKPEPRVRTSNSEEGEAILRRMRRRQRPTLILEPSDQPVRSKLGGRPALDESMEWPRAADGKAMSFLAQIDLAEVQAAGEADWLPLQGRLLFFARLDGANPQQCVVLYSDGPAGDGREGAEPASFAERPVRMRPVLSYPSLDWMGVNVRELEVDSDELDQLADYPSRHFDLDQPEHRIAGYPHELQDETMALTCQLAAGGDDRAASEVYETPEALAKANAAAARSWRLLLQIDSDRALKMNLGHGGRLYVFVRERDARAGNFSRTWTIRQSM